MEELIQSEEIVAQYLTRTGYKTKISPHSSKTYEIEALGELCQILIKVKSAFYPDVPGCLTSDEEQDIRLKAESMCSIPWEAKVQLDRNLQIVGKINWRLLQ
jgi:hypothetical protein